MFANATVEIKVESQHQGRHALFKGLLLGAKWFKILPKHTSNSNLIQWLISWDSQKVNPQNLLNTNHFRHTYGTEQEDDTYDL